MRGAPLVCVCVCVPLRGTRPLRGAVCVCVGVPLRGAARPAERCVSAARIASGECVSPIFIGYCRVSQCIRAWRVIGVVPVFHH